MGTGGTNETQSKEPIKQLYNQEEENFQLTCSECILIPKILEIDYKNYSIKYECPKHGNKEENIKKYIELSEKFLYKNNQNNSEKCIDDKEKKQKFYYCLQCKNFLCKQCGDNHEHKEFIKINDPENKNDIHLNNYCKFCICKKQLYDDQQINCKNEEENIKADIQKIKNKNNRLKEKMEYGEYMIELLDKLIIYEEEDSNHLNNNNLINASKSIIEKENEKLLKKLENLENKMSYYLKNDLGIKIEENGIELSVIGKTKLCNLDLIILNKSDINLKNIENLNLENNNIDDIAILNEIDLPNLKNVNLKNNKITSILNLKNIMKKNKKLETLNLSHNLIQKDKVNVDEINDNDFQYVKEINLDKNKEIEKEFEEIKEILNLNQKFRNGKGCTLKYKIKDEDKNEDGTKIFGSEFVSNNTHKCKIKINGKDYELCQFFKDEKGEINKKILYIKLIFNEDIDDISGIFDGCKSLISISDISNWDISKFTNMNRLFSECISLESLPDISGWDTSKVTTMEMLFNQCNSLKSLPDIGDWDISNVTNIERLFYQCTSLSSLPDISGWNTSNVTNMNYVFHQCKNLKSLPNIGKWNFSNVTTMFNMFSYCQSLTSLPNLSRLDISNVTDLSNLFEGCSSLISLPDISKWNINKVKNMSKMFNGCSLIKSFSYLSNWNLSKVKADGMFEGCEKGIKIQQ